MGGGGVAGDLDRNHGWHSLFQVVPPTNHDPSSDWHALMTDADLLQRITINPQIFGGKPIIRGRRLAVEHVLGMLSAGDTAESLLKAYPWLESDDIRACLVYARRLVGHEQIELLPAGSAP